MFSLTCLVISRNLCQQRNHFFHLGSDKSLQNDSQILLWLKSLLKFPPIKLETVSCTNCASDLWPQQWPHHPRYPLILWIQRRLFIFPYHNITTWTDAYRLGNSCSLKRGALNPALPSIVPWKQRVYICFMSQSWWIIWCATSGFIICFCPLRTTHISAIWLHIKAKLQNKGYIRHYDFKGNLSFHF